MHFLDNPYILPIVAYFIGSIPFGLIFSRLKGKDPRNYGSGNIGATNIARGLGKSWGVITLICDMLKGFLPVFLATTLKQPNFIVALTGLSAVVGHCFSIFLFFKGGKGVATALGVFLAICPKAILPALIIFLFVAYYFRYVSVASLAAATTIPMFIHFLYGDTFFETMSWTVCFLIWIRHKDNLMRLAKGEEKKINFLSRGT